MSSDRCSRCGRERRVDDPLETLAEGAWLEDICPRCQSEEERREAVERSVAAIKREIERRREHGLDPDEYEAAMGVYAMAMGASGTPQADRLRLRVAMTGALLTGHPIAVRLDNYRQLQAALGRRLEGPQWRTADLDTPRGTFESGGGFT